MKTKIKVKVLTEGCMPEIVVGSDWIDLRSAKDITIRAAQAGTQYKEGDDKYRDVHMHTTYIPLGVAMELPAGYEAIVASRSSGPKKLRLFIPSGQGIIDNKFNGNDDEWHYVTSSMTNTHIKKGDRICQFRIQLNQHASMWQKIKWLFSSGVELVQVESLNNTGRGGLGSTGIK